MADYDKCLGDLILLSEKSYDKAMLPPPFKDKPIQGHIARKWQVTTILCPRFSWSGDFITDM